MYQERIDQLNAGLQAYDAQITQFLALADFLYKDLGLIGEVHSHVTGDEATYKLILIDKPSSSVQIRKVYNEDGTSTDWEYIDLADF